MGKGAQRELRSYALFVSRSNHTTTTTQRAHGNAMSKQTVHINPLSLLGDPGDPLGGYWLARTKNNHAVFCVAAQSNPTGREYLGSFSLEQAQQLRVMRNPVDTAGTAICVLEVTMASGSVYEFSAALPVTEASASLTALIAGPCCDDPYPVVP